MAKYLDSNGLSHLIGKIKTALAGKMDAVTLATVATTGDYDDLTDKPTIPAPGTGSSYPAMDGTRALGSNAGYARVDHVHPTDTSRSSNTHTHGDITRAGDITATAPTVASGDKIIINDESESKVTNGPSFGTSTTTYLRNNGTWGTPAGTTYSDYDGSTHGLVPVADDQYSVLAGGGSWWGVPELMAAHMAAYPALFTAGFVKYDGADITTGALAASDIPSLAISKITNLQTILPDLGNLKAPLASPALTGTPTAPTAASGTNTTQIATTAFVQSALGDVAGALVYKGTVSAASGMANFKKGWYWIASGSFTIGSGSTAENVEAGDMLIANADGTSATAANIDVIQTNIETLTTTEIDTIWAAA